MSREIIVFWRHSDGTRCVVVRAQPHGWRLLVQRGEDILLAEQYDDARRLLVRAMELRPLFGSAVA